MNSDAKTFGAVVIGARGGAILVPLPFDPDAAWGPRPRHLVTGRVGPHKVRGALAPHAGGHALKLGPAWTRDNPVSAGDTVEVTLAPEGPQRTALDADLVAALVAEPEAAAFFDGLAQFYRKLYLTWIGGTKSRPDERARRIAETVRLLKAGVKQPK
jgi:hypothetical protein